MYGICVRLEVSQSYFLNMPVFLFTLCIKGWSLNLYCISHDVRLLKATMLGWFLYRLFLFFTLRLIIQLVN